MLYETKFINEVFMENIKISINTEFSRIINSTIQMIFLGHYNHFYRAVYNARKLGIDAYGFAADELKYPIYNDVREALARTKDFFYCIIQPEPTYLGDPISIHASGSLTDDKERI